MNFKAAWSQYRWAGGTALLAAVLVGRIWSDGVLPGVREAVGLRNRLDSLERVAAKLPVLEQRWKQMQSGRKQEVAPELRDSAAATRIQGILLRSGLLAGTFRIEAAAGGGHLPLLLKGGFLDVARLLKALEREGAVPVEWEMRPVSSTDLECKVTLMVHGLEASP